MHSADAPADSQVSVESYLRRIAYDGPRAPTLAVLSALQRAHMTAIPFENIDVMLGRPISLAPQDLERKLIAQRRGGYCFEHNLLFAAVLRALGFELQTLAGRVHAGSASAVPPRTHMVLLVAIDGVRFVVDPAFGAFGARTPLPLEAGRVHEGICERHRLRKLQGVDVEEWMLEGEHLDEFKPLYSFTLEPRHRIDYEVANHYTSTHPDSRFRRMLVVQRVTPDGRIVLRGSQLTRRVGAQEQVSTVGGGAALVEVLEAEFGLRVPEAAALTVLGA